LKNINMLSSPRQSFFRRIKAAQTRVMANCGGLRLLTLSLTSLLATAALGQPLRTDPNSACASCHRQIYDRYRSTPMANASGPATVGLMPGDFRHATSGVHYNVFQEASQAWLSYERDDSPKGRELSGRQQLRYFIGSGKRGRTYLFQQQGYWFEAPINWYGKQQIWDMPPNYQTAKQMPFTLPVDPGCLSCHTSGVAPSLPDARNHYAAEPFADSGITCASCHGDASAHIASGGKVKLANIDAMEPVRRDSVCLACHLEGQVAVARLGKQRNAFAPGDNLFDYALYFVRASEKGSGGRATSQFEALLKSQCKRKSGDKLTCTTCHDPHGSPAPAERVAFYREKCIQCHNTSGFAETHHPENPDCVSCHMARPPSNDIAHEQVTDHWIKKRVTQDRLPLATNGDLLPVGGMSASDRDLGLAYAQMAARGNQDDGEQALQLLRHAEKQSDGAPTDHELHAQLGFLQQVAGKTQEAADEYRQALKADPYDSLAGGNLALIDAQQRNYPEAIRLWTSVFTHDPVQIEAGMNLAIVQCGLGQRTATVQTLNRILTFDPDNDRARTMLTGIRSGTQSCQAK
jgi:predicted CXXCH cytochrome family protein